MSGSVDDGDVIFGGLKLPQRDVDGDSSLPFCFQLVQYPGVLKGALPHLSGEEIKHYNGVHPRADPSLVSYVPLCMAVLLQGSDLLFHTTLLCHHNSLLQVNQTGSLQSLMM